jgi:outer membrane cobalamin receptor
MRICIAPRTRQAFACCLLSTMAAPQAVAASDQDLEQVTVTANRLEEELPQELAKYGTRVEIISAEQIKNGGFVDIAQALATLAPGLFISPKNGPFDYVHASFQGSSTGDILWLVDGVRINNRLYNGTTPLDTLPASIVDRIEIIEGGQALFYGTQAVAGAVNIVTKAFSDSPDGALSVAADTINDHHFDGYARDSVGKNQFVIYGSADKSIGFQPFRDQDYQPSTTDRRRAYEVLTLGGKYAYNFTDQIRLSLSEQHTDGRLDFAVPELVNTAFNDRDEDLATAKLDIELSDRVQFFLKAYYHNWHSHYTEFDNTIPPGDTLLVVENDGPWGYRDYGANLLAKLKFGRLFEYFVGYDLQKYSGSDAVLVITPHTESTQAVFAQIRTSSELFSNLKLAAGVRYSDPSAGQSDTVWNLSGRYDITPALFVRGQVGTAFRLPTAEELFANDPEDERGNPNLKPETSTNANLSIGVRFDFGVTHNKAELIGFYREVKNLIDFTSFDDATGQAVFGNVPGTVSVRGGELSLETAAFDSLSGIFNYTYNNSVDPGTQIQVANIPKDLLKLGIDYHPANQPWGASLSVNHFGRTYATGLWDGTEAYGGETIIDLSGRVFLDPRRRQRIDLSVQNLFDRQYATGLGTATRDADGSNYTYWNLGVPRNLRVSYTYAFR